MSEKVEKLKAALAELSPEDRDGIRTYLDSLEEAELTPEQWEEAWTDEINRRIADINAGEAKLIPAEEVSRKMREKYG